MKVVNDVHNSKSDMSSESYLSSFIAFLLELLSKSRLDAAILRGMCSRVASKESSYSILDALSFTTCEPSRTFPILFSYFFCYKWLGRTTGARNSS